MPSANEYEPFEAGEIISEYRDQAAVGDGVLVPLGRDNRVSRALFDWVAEHAKPRAFVPDNWPISQGTWSVLLGDEQGDLRASALLVHLIRQYRNDAVRTYNLNLDGGIWKAVIRYDAQGIVALHPATRLQGDAPQARVIWLMPNENGGVTAMFPEDY